jgi:hypothetical protein
MLKTVFSMKKLVKPFDGTVKISVYAFTPTKSIEIILQLPNLFQSLLVSRLLPPTLTPTKNEATQT